MDAIALGCLTALLVWRKRFSRLQLWSLGSGGLALLIFSLCFSIRVYIWGLGRNGLNMTVLALGTSMVIVVAAQTQWKSPRIFSPLTNLGRRSYEVYLTHMFVVFALFGLFVKIGKPMRGVPVLFIAVIVVAGMLGEAVARFFSDPMNRNLRRRFGDGSDKLGTVVEADGNVERDVRAAV
jgi:peptidoglycan/LPS O-acetylase OafA/YrhL